MTAVAGDYAFVEKRESGRALLLWNRLCALWLELAHRPRLAVIVMGALPLLIRVAVLHWYPIPKPKVADEFSHLLIADTFASGRIVNPTHPFWRHFETVYEFQRPVYASIYPPGQGLLLAAGQVIAGHPWWAVWASCGLMCGAICWMLYAWMAPGWALLGTLICVTQIGVTSYWMNGYWGGGMPAFGGALALGALPRLLRANRISLSFVFAFGLAIIISIRPYEGALFACALGGFLAVALMRQLLLERSSGSGWSGLVRSTLGVLLPVTAVALLTAAGLGYYNFRVTGSSWLNPYQLSQKMYGVPRGLSFQAAPREPSDLTPDQRDTYRWQNSSPMSKHRKWEFFRDFYFGGPLLTALCFLPLGWRNRSIFLLAAICIFVGFGVSLYWYFVNHYLAPLTGALFGLVALALREVWNWRLLPPLVRKSTVAAVLLFHVVFNIGGKYVVKPTNQSLRFDRYAENRSKIEAQLMSLSGQHLVFVRTKPTRSHDIQWIYNRATIDTAKIVWAREIDPQEDVRLIKYFVGRTVWLVEADANPVRLIKLSTMPPG